MPRSRRDIQAVAAETTNPPDQLPASQAIARVQQAAGNNLYRVERADGSVLLAELPARFRSTIWIKRGGYVVVDADALAARDNKLQGEIVNVVREEKVWRRMPYWPAAFAKSAVDAGDGGSDEDGDDDLGPQMPPSDESEDEAR